MRCWGCCPATCVGCSSRARDGGSDAQPEDIDKLLSVRAAEGSVLSLYQPVPIDPPAQRGLLARADELFALAARGSRRDHARRPRAHE